MNVVIYTKDMEPITVIDLPPAMIRFGQERHFLRVPVQVPVPAYLPPGWSVDDAVVDSAVIRTVALEFSELRMPDGKTSCIVVTHDEEFALALRPAWLPGQRGAINDYERSIRKLGDALLQALSRGMGR